MRRSAGALLLLLPVTLVLLGAADVLESDVELEIWPRLQNADQTMEPAGFSARMEPYPDFFPAVVKPAGIPFRAPAGRFSVYLEGRGFISPHIHVFSLRPSELLKPISHKKVGLTVLPAGVVKLTPDVGVESGHQVRFLALESQNALGLPMPELCRRIRDVAEARAGIQMPPGATLVSIAAPDNSLVALSRPFQVQVGAKIDVTPAPPAPALGHVFAILEMPHSLERLDQYGTTAVLRSEDRPPLEPLVVSPSADRVYLVWYDVPPGDYFLRVDSKSFHHPDQPVRALGGKIRRESLRLQPKPALRVELDLHELLKGPRSLEVREGTAVVDTFELDSRQKSLEIPALPAAELVVTLDVGPWRFRQNADLRSGDATLRFAPEPFSVSGKVSRAQKPVSAVLEFSTDLRRQLPFEVESDQDGRYEALLWRAGSYLVRLLPAGVDLPFLEMIEVEEAAWQEHDFELPANDYRVVARDLENGQVIARARVKVGVRAEGGADTSISGETNARGILVLPPVRAGELFVTVEADGYSPGEAPPERVSPESAGRLLEVGLRPIGDGISVALRLDDYRPAAQAEIRVMSGGFDLLWQGQTDSAGKTRLPTRAIRADAWLLARHPGAGALVHALAGFTDEKLELSLPSARPIELLVASREVEKLAALGLLAAGTRFSGPTAAWLVGLPSPYLRSGEPRQVPGFSRHLLAVGAISPEAIGRFHAGELDAFLVPLPPRPNATLEIVAAP